MDARSPGRVHSCCQHSRVGEEVLTDRRPQETEVISCLSRRWTAFQTAGSREYNGGDLGNSVVWPRLSQRKGHYASFYWASQLISYMNSYSSGHENHNKAVSSH